MIIRNHDLIIVQSRLTISDVRILMEQHQCYRGAVAHIEIYIEAETYQSITTNEEWDQYMKN